MDEALALSVAALGEWMADRVAAGQSAPRPRSAEDIRADPAAAEDLEANPVMATVPLMLDAGRSVRASLSFDAGLLEAIDAAASSRGLTRSAFLASAAREKIAAER